MSFAPAVLLGSQVPSVESAPPRRTTAGPDAVEYAAYCNLDLDPWQGHTLECWLGEAPDGSWAAFECCGVVPRQNGKGGVLEARELFGCQVAGERLIVHTAHELATVEEAFERMKSIIDAAPLKVRQQALKPIEGNGRQTIRWKNGARIKYRSRSKASGRGLSGDVVILDEAMMSVTPAMLGALVPLMSARSDLTVGGPQLIYAASAGLAESEHLRGLRERALTGEDASLAYVEWGNDPGTDLDDREAWRRANPALGIRISEEFVARERAALPDEEFARERLGIWELACGANVIDPQMWRELADTDSAAAGGVALAIDVSPDQEHAAVAVAGRRADGLPHLEVIEALPKDGWVVEFVVAVAAKNDLLSVTLDPKSPAVALVAPLTAAGIEVSLLKANDVAAGCAGLFSDVVAGTLRHRDQAALNAAVEKAGRRPLGDGWAWRRRGLSDDITPLTSITFARHALLAGPPPEEPSVYETRGLVGA